MGTRSPLTYFLNRDKIEPLKIILSPCLVNISDWDMIPIDIFFKWGQDKNFKNHLVPMVSTYFCWEQDPIDIFFEWGQDRTIENYLVSMRSKNFQWG